MPENRYVPAAGFRVFTRLYDPVLAVTMREGRFRDLMCQRIAAELPRGGAVVDVGCGTGTFAIALAADLPDGRVLGIDGDTQILSRARGKTGAERVEWREALAGGLPLPDRSVDAVTMSLVLHHLLPEDKRAALLEARRVLRPGGRLHIADWGRPHDPVMRGVFFVGQMIDGFARTRDHAAGRLPAIVAGAGFQGPECYGRMRTGFGSLELLSAGLN